MPSEFDLIARHFTRGTRHTVLGVGDDGALVAPSSGCELVVSTDMLVEGTHFLADTPAEDLGWKSLAVNLSDIAAMGARPRWATLALALPDADEAWIAAFAGGFFACASEFHVDLIGGDTTRGPRNICVTIFGETVAGQAVRRGGAKPGDEIWISGAPGRAALGLAHLQGRIALPEERRAECLAALQRPQPRVALGLALPGLASAAIDVSDGLLADLKHVLDASGLAAAIEIAVTWPRSGVPGTQSEPGPTLGTEALLAGGDDYEILFTVPAAHHEDVLALSSRMDLPLTHIGRTVAGTAGDIRVCDMNGNPIRVGRHGYDHFR